MARKNPIFHVGNYAAPIDTAGLDKDMADLGLRGTPPSNMNKVESDYTKQAKNRASAYEAVRRTRRANKPR